MALDQGRECPGPERLAEYADGVLTPEARAEIERHLADCADCRHVVAETMAFAEAEAIGGAGSAPVSAARVVPFRSRRWVSGVTVGLAAAALLVVAVRVVRPQWSDRFFGTPSDRPELRELVAALASEPTRPVEGRLTGGFKYAPPPSPTRGPGDREVSPDVRIAAAKIEKLAIEHDTAQNQAALGVGYLALGAVDKAVEALEDAASQAPRDATVQSDLSAAYLARAKGLDRPDDLAKALAAADRAIGLDAGRPEPHFNRALALEGLHLTDQALEAWVTYRSMARQDPWSVESSDHERTLRERIRERSPDPSKPDRQSLREQIEDRLLAEWGRAIVKADEAAAEKALTEASKLSDQLTALHGDAMVEDELLRIRAARVSHDRVQLRSLAMGHDLYGAARQQYVTDNQEKAAEQMTLAAEHFRRANSPYWQWAPVYKAIFLRNKGRTQEALDELERLRLDRIPSEYRNLRGRLTWTAGVALNELGRYDLGRERLKQSVDEFRQVGESDNLIATQTILADAEWFLGDRVAAWRDLLQVLAYIEVRGQTRRNYHYWVAATLALGIGLPDAALEFQNARVRSVDTPRFRTEAFLHRARTLALMGDDARASQDLDRASEAVSQLTDSALRERNFADIEIARAELASRTDCPRAIRHADRALTYVQAADPAIRLGGLLRVRAKCRGTLGDFDGAKTDLTAAIAAFEVRRASFASIEDRIQAFEQERAAFKDLIEFDFVTLRDEDAGLRAAERSRSGVIAERWSREIENPVDPTTSYRDLDADVAVVYYETLSDRVLVWVLTREGRAAFTRRIPALALDSTIDRIQRVIRQGANLTALRPHTVGVFDALVAPALRLAPSKTVVFFIPDGPLFRLPFAALPDADGQPLMATRTIGIAPSLTMFLAASARLRTFEADDVLAVGDGHDLAHDSLPVLLGANEEAVNVARMYPKSVVLIGRQATKRRFLNERRAVIHFAGHTVWNRQFPMLSRMLLAPDPFDGDSGMLLGSEIASATFSTTSVVVLATCDGAAGTPIDGEGPISIGRAFFAAGVPAVIASLWSVNDDLAEFLARFHAELRERRDAAGALRAAQLALLRERGRAAPVQVWGGFIMFGGSALAH